MLHAHVQGIVTFANQFLLTNDSCEHNNYIAACIHTNQENVCFQQTCPLKYN